MGFPFIPVLAVTGLGGLAYFALRKPQPKALPYRPGTGGTAVEFPDASGNYNVPSSSIPVSLPSPSGPIAIELPVGISSDVYQVVNAPNQLLLRSSPNIDGHAPGQGNVIGSLPNGTIVKKVPGTEIGKNKTGDNPGGFMNIQDLRGQIGWAAVDYLQKADIGQVA
jgi:hypothetical protein